MTFQDKTIGKLLIIDDDEDVLLAAKMLLKKHAHHVITEKNPKKIPFLLNNDSYDVILLDMNFSKDITSGKEGFYWLHQITEHDKNAVVILITAFGDVEMAVRALKEGATDFILKPWQNEKLLATISTAIKLKKSYQEVDQLKKAKRQLEDDLNQPFKEIIGQSSEMKKIFDLIDKLGEADANILILGENGTGKELIARAIHQKSKRKEAVFSSVDFTAISNSEFEKEMFGTSEEDAKENENHHGKLEIANGGTLYIQEVGNLNRQLQTKLLTTIQEGAFTREGEQDQIPFNIRIISSTNLPIHEMVIKNEFRSELLYLLNTVEIVIPPLRERPEDITQIADHYLQTYNRKYRKSIERFNPDTYEVLKNYEWPGNVIELQHAIERAVITSNSNELKPEDFFFLSWTVEVKVYLKVIITIWKK